MPQVRMSPTCASASAWCSRRPTPSPCPSMTTWPTAPHPRHPQQGEAGRDRGGVPAGRGHLGRGEGPAEKVRPGPLRRPAAAAVHRPGPGGEAGRPADGRVHLRPGPHLHLQDRGPCRRAEKKDYTIIMVTHNMQQAARISDKTAFFLLGDHGGVRRHGADVLHAPGQEDGRLHHREVRIMRDRIQRAAGTAECGADQNGSLVRGGHFRRRQGPAGRTTPPCGRPPALLSGRSTRRSGTSRACA